MKKFNCKKGARIKIARGILFYVLIHHQQKYAFHECGNSRNFHGAMLSRNSDQGCSMKFDEFLSDWKEVFAKRRNKITLADPVEEEKEYGREIEECAMIEEDMKDNDYQL